MKKTTKWAIGITLGITFSISVTLAIHFYNVNQTLIAKDFSVEMNDTVFTYDGRTYEKVTINKYYITLDGKIVTEMSAQF